jgi:hypothetical protein
MKHITDGKGKWIGHVDERSDSKIYTDETGKVVSRVINDKTYDAKGKFTGQGDLGMIEIGKKQR